MWPRPTSSMESAMISRLTSEVFIPSAPVVTIIDRDRVDLDRCPTGSSHTFGCVGGELPVIPVAGHGTDPAMGDADLRPCQAFIGESDRLHHGSRHDQGLRAVCGCYVADLRASVLPRIVSSSASAEYRPRLLTAHSTVSTVLPHSSGKLSHAVRNPAPCGPQ